MIFQETLTVFLNHCNTGSDFFMHALLIHLRKFIYSGLISTELTQALFIRSIDQANRRNFSVLIELGRQNYSFYPTIKLRRKNKDN